ncbi:MAG: GNAT family N-acetyltransferase [Treponema sp.]|jgi:ribosomal protein S18 acetylase RimI-like enzyme|nr:GNAT family N-acetyltransferase [Treponema sp.]
MRFELDKVLIDDIIFFMENQDGEFLIDIQEGQVIDINNNETEEEPDYNDGRFIPLPGWSSQDGFRLMEHFTAGLKNPVARHDLSVALTRSKGVFRAFKNVLESYPEIEKMWFIYKDKEMKNEVISWYNSLREEWGLEPIGMEPDDTSSLVLEDFSFREGDDELGYPSFIAGINGESAGSVSATINNQIMHIDHLEVKSEYRGMGLGKTLLSKLIEIADEKNLDMTIDVPVDAEFFSRSLLLENFVPCMQRFIRKK